MQRFRLFSSVLLLAVNYLVAPVRAADAPSQADYVILYAQGLESSAQAWAKYRAGTGFTPRLIPWADFAGSDDPVRAARTAIHQAYRSGKTPPPVGWLLILGDAPDGGNEAAAPPKKLNFDPTRIPLHVHATLKDASRPPELVAGDFMWALPPEVEPDVTGLGKYGAAGLGGGLKNGGLPKEVAVGRVPARNDQQATTVLEKVRRYESAPSGEWQRRLSFVASEGRFDPLVDRMLESMFVKFGDTIVPPRYEIGMTYASAKSAWACPPDELPQKVVTAIKEGSLLTAYIGHGLVTRFDSMRVRDSNSKEKRFPIGDRDSITKQLGESRSDLTIMLIVACQTGCFDNPEEESLGEGLLFAPGGPVALLAGSRDTHPYANALVQKEFISAITGESAGSTPAGRVGGAWLATQRYLLAGGDDYFTKIESMAGLMIPPEPRTAIREAHLWLYNLLGDPATRIQRPAAWPDDSLRVKNLVRPAGSSFEVELAHPAYFHDQAPSEKSLRLEARLEVQPSVLLDVPQAVDWGKLLSGSKEERKAERVKLEANYAMANRKVVGEPVTREIPMGDDAGKTPMKEISIPIPSSLAPGSYRLRVSLQLGSGDQAKFLTRCYEVKVGS